MISLYEQMRLDTIEAIRSVYRRHAAGCCLHIVTDDGNIKNDSIAFTIENLNRSHEDCKIAIHGLSSMRLTARRKAIAEATRPKFLKVVPL